MRQIGNYPIIEIPNPLLETVSSPIEKIEEYKEALLELLKSCNENKTFLGVSLIQIGIPKRAFIGKIGKNFEPEIIINPEIMWKSKLLQISLKDGEQCLSVPKKSVKILRSYLIRVRYLDVNGKTVKRTLRGMQSIVFQHEFDHLNGVLITHKEKQLVLVRS